MGPYTGGHKGQNLHAVVEAAERIIRMGGFPVVPHTNLTWELVEPHNYDFWLAYGMYLLDRCDAAYRVPGHSPGSDKETESCILSRNIRVFFDATPEGRCALFKWITDWLEEHDPTARHPNFRQSRELLLDAVGILG
jgi:hypothetical protein